MNLIICLLVKYESFLPLQWEFLRVYFMLNLDMHSFCCRLIANYCPGNAKL